METGKVCDVSESESGLDVAVADYIPDCDPRKSENVSYFLSSAQRCEQALARLSPEKSFSIVKKTDYTSVFLSSVNFLLSFGTKDWGSYDDYGFDHGPVDYFVVSANDTK